MTALAKLEDAGLIVITKQFIGKKPNTTIALTAKGKLAIERHWRTLEELRKRTRPS